MCHVLWMMPILGLPLFWVFDFPLALSLYLGVLGLSGVVMLLTVQSIKQRPASGIEGMMGDVAEVVETIGRRGRVRHHSELWFATAREPIAAGEKVRIVGNKGLCLLVERWSQAPEVQSTTEENCPMRHTPIQGR